MTNARVVIYQTGCAQMHGSRPLIYKKTIPTLAQIPIPILRLRKPNLMGRLASAGQPVGSTVTWQTCPRGQQVCAVIGRTPHIDVVLECGLDSCDLSTSEMHAFAR